MIYTADEVALCMETKGDNRIREITEFREVISSLLEIEASASQRNIIIFALDGIGYEIANECWRMSKNELMQSVFPTTSSACWMSSLTGLSVDDHGIPGVVFKMPNNRTGDLINIYEFDGTVVEGGVENIFSDALRYAYNPVAILGDLEDYGCSWTRTLLSHSTSVAGHSFFGQESHDSEPKSAAKMCDKIRLAVAEALKRRDNGRALLVWCFIECDRHIHRYGFDTYISKFLGEFEKVAMDLCEDDCIVVAHSDHGLTKTKNDPCLERLLTQLGRELKFEIGGAGRTRWIYPLSVDIATEMDRLRRELPSSISVHRRNELFARGSLAYDRVGKVVLVAHGEEFLAPLGYSYDHGSLSAAELDVPLAVWGA